MSTCFYLRTLVIILFLEILSWSFVAQRIAKYTDYKTAKSLRNAFVLADNATSR